MLLVDGVIRSRKRFLTEIMSWLFDAQTPMNAPLVDALPPIDAHLLKNRLDIRPGRQLEEIQYVGTTRSRN